MTSGSDGHRGGETLADRLWDVLPLGSVTQSQFEPAYTIFDRLRTIHRAPLRNLRHSLWWIRKTFFTRPRSETPAYLVDMTKPEVVRLFGRNHFEPGWELSYNYLGEVLNLRRVEHHDDKPYEWWQVHIRGYLHDDGGIELSAHFETEPSEHPDAHVSMYGLDVEYGMDEIQVIMNEEGVEYTHLSPDEVATVTDSTDRSVDAGGA